MVYFDRGLHFGRRPVTPRVYTDAELEQWRENFVTEARAHRQNDLDRWAGRVMRRREHPTTTDTLRSDR